MAFTKLNYGKSWTNQADFPTYQENEEQVRADLQYHPDAVKAFINDTLLKALEAQAAAGNLGAMQDGAAATIQSVLDSHGGTLLQLAEDIQTLAAGGVPMVAQSCGVNFTAESWSAAEGGAVLVIPKSDHKRENANFGYSIYQLVDGVYKSGTWGAAATRMVYGTDGSITLTADEAYSGRIVFFGL